MGLGPSPGRPLLFALNPSFASPSHLRFGWLEHRGTLEFGAGAPQVRPARRSRTGQPAPGVGDPPAAPHSRLGPFFCTLWNNDPSSTVGITANFLQVEWGSWSIIMRNGHRDELTPRQREIARLVGRHMTSREIGRVLGISPRTVEVHRAAIGRKRAYLQKAPTTPLNERAFQRAFERLSVQLQDLAQELAAVHALTARATARAGRRRLTKRPRSPL